MDSNCPGLSRFSDATSGWCFSTRSHQSELLCGVTHGISAGFGWESSLGSSGRIWRKSTQIFLQPSNISTRLEKHASMGPSSCDLHRILLVKLDQICRGYYILFLRHPLKHFPVQSMTNPFSSSTSLAYSGVIPESFLSRWPISSQRSWVKLHLLRSSPERMPPRSLKPFGSKMNLGGTHGKMHVWGRSQDTFLELRV